MIAKAFLHAMESEAAIFAKEKRQNATILSKIILKGHDDAWSSGRVKGEVLPWGLGTKLTKEVR